MRIRAVPIVAAGWLLGIGWRKAYRLAASGDIETQDVDGAMHVPVRWLAQRLKRKLSQHELGAAIAVADAERCENAAARARARKRRASHVEAA